MSKFTKQISKTYDFQGDTVRVKMKRLKRKDAIKLAPLMSEPDKDGNVKMSLYDSMEFVGVANEVLLNCVTSFSGLLNEEEEPIFKEEIFGEESEVYFMELTSQIMGDLMEASFASGDKEKKSKRQPKDTSGECEEETHS